MDISQCSTMKSGTVNIDDSLGNYYMFYSVPAVLNHNKDREIGTVIAEYKRK